MKHSKTVLFVAFLGLRCRSPPSGRKRPKSGHARLCAGLSWATRFRSESSEQPGAGDGAESERRPAEKVRSMSEVFLHVAFGNYIITKMMGFEPPAEAKFSMDIEKWDTQTTDMGKIDDILRASFDHVRGVAKKMSAADLEKKMNLFGMEMTWRNGLISTLDHMHEHLGQSIAYARMNANRAALDSGGGGGGKSEKGKRRVIELTARRRQSRRRYHRGRTNFRKTAAMIPRPTDRFHRHRCAKVRDHLALCAARCASANHVCAGQGGLLFRRHDPAPDGRQRAGLLRARRGVVSRAVPGRAAERFPSAASFVLPIFTRKKRPNGSRLSPGHQIAALPSAASGDDLLLVLV